MALRFDPFRGHGLKLPYDFAQRHILGEHEQNVDVVLHRSDHDRWAFSLPQDSD